MSLTNWWRLIKPNIKLNNELQNDLKSGKNHLLNCKVDCITKHLDRASSPSALKEGCPVDSQVNIIFDLNFRYVARFGIMFPETSINKT